VVCRGYGTQTKAHAGGLPNVHGMNIAYRWHGTSFAYCVIYTTVLITCIM
jgi:hypothetical protein